MLIKITHHAYARAAQRLGLSADKFERLAQNAAAHGEITSVEKSYEGNRFVFTPEGLLLTVIVEKKAQRTG
jgi:hypothetical protein